MKVLASTKGNQIILDDADYERLCSYSWYAHSTGNKGHRPARRESTGDRKVIFLVHEIMRAPKGMVVDHINGNPWDNRRSNLRFCTQAQNSRNRKPHGAREYKGISAIYSRWRALIRCNGVIHTAGIYDTPREAACAYDDVAAFLHGDFCRLNFPDRHTVMAPADVLRAGSERFSKTKAAVVADIASGITASASARRWGVSVANACRWAAKSGITLTRGRPRLDAVSA